MSSTYGIPLLVIEHDAHAFALREHARLYAAFQSDRAAITGQESAVFTRDENGDVIGLIAWEHAEDDHTAWVALVAVDPGHQRAGMFTRLWRELEVEALRAGCVSVRLGVAVDNVAARAAYASVGLVPTFVAYEGALT